MAADGAHVRSALMASAVNAHAAAAAALTALSGSASAASASHPPGSENTPPDGGRPPRQKARKKPKRKGVQIRVLPATLDKVLALVKSGKLAGEKLKLKPAGGGKAEQAVASWPKAFEALAVGFAACSAGPDRATRAMRRAADRNDARALAQIASLRVECKEKDRAILRLQQRNSELQGRLDVLERQLKKKKGPQGPQSFRSPLVMRIGHSKRRVQDDRKTGRLCFQGMAFHQISAYVFKGPLHLERMADLAFSDPTALPLLMRRALAVLNKRVFTSANVQAFIDGGGSSMNRTTFSMWAAFQNRFARAWIADMERNCADLPAAMTTPVKKAKDSEPQPEMTTTCAVASGGACDCGVGPGPPWRREQRTGSRRRRRTRNKRTPP